MVYPFCERQRPMILAAGIALWIATSAPAQVFVEDSPAANELLLAAEDRLEKGEPEEAAKSIQKLLDQHGTKLLELEPGRYSESRRVIARRLLDRPELLTAYRALYGPQAAQHLERAAQDSESLESIFHRYGLTDAGLDAALRLVGLELERGEADSALVVLTQVAEHPSLDSRRALWLHLKAVALLLLGERHEYEDVHRLLQEAGAPSAVAEVDRLAATLAVESAHPLTYSPLEPLPQGRLPEQLQQSLWDVPIEGAEHFIRSKYQPEATHLGEQFDRGRYLNTVPFLTGGRLLINDGQSVMAIEPASGRLLWRQRIAEDDMIGGNVIRSYQWLPTGLDLNCVAASAQHVLVVCGFGAMATQYPFVESPSSTWLACLDVRTGKVLWSRRPEEVAGDLMESFWYGRPIVSEGRVYMTLRRRQRTQFNDAYIVALDTGTGDLIWRRHLAAVAITNRQFVPGYVHALLDRGWLYVDTRLGTVARLSALDGAIDWLTVLDSPMRPSGDGSTRAFEVASPVITDAGLIVLDPMGQAIRLVDPETGALRDKIRAMDWSWPVYLIALENGDILSIGQQIHRIHGGDLSKVWTHDTRGEELRGRVVLSGPSAYVPMGAGLVPLNLLTGESSRPLSIRMPANVLTRDGQVIAVHRDTVSGYTTWAVASGQLRQRAAERPDDPRPLIDLAWLALRTDNPQAVVQSLDGAVKAVAEGQTSDETRQAVFDTLLDMVGHEKLKGRASLRQELFDRMALVASGPDQEVALRFALGQFLEERGDPAQAVEQYQIVLSDPEYRRRPFKDSQRSGPASLEAYARLARLLKTHGRKVYEPFDMFAAQRLEELRVQVDPDAVVELTESHPLALVVPEALRLAAARAADLDRPHEAVSLLRRIRWESQPSDQAAQVFSQEVALLEKIGEPARAARVLRFLLAAYPTAAPVREGRAIDPANWLQMLDAAAQSNRSIQDIDFPLSAPRAVLPGRVMRPLAQDPLSPVHEGLLLATADGLELRRLEDLEVVWKRPVTLADVQLLSMDWRRVWLWYPGESRLEVVATSNGMLIWETRDLARKVEAIEPPRAEPRVREIRVAPGRIVRFPGQLPGRFPRDPAAGDPRQRERIQMTFALNDAVIAVADGHGRVMVLDAFDGRTLWQAATEIRRLSQFLMDERHVILSGFRGSEEEGQPWTSVYDAQSGMLRYGISADTELQEPEWLGLSEDGRLIQVSRLRIQAFDLARGQPAWTARPEVALNGQAGAWMNQGRLVLQTRDDDPPSIGADLIWIDLADGRIVHRQSVRGKLDPPIRVLGRRSEWFLIDADRCIATGPDGVPLWTDSITTAGRFLEPVVTEGQLIILAIPAEAEIANSHERKLFVLDPSTGVLRHEQQLEAAGPVHWAAAAGGRLIVSGDQITAVFGGQ